ncbi:MULTISPECIES: ATP-binding cassette domain-containing protein [unclassified Streptomyces]|uniref:ATP-binding cassette domain-containing protein n=1 Tax=unclassified Streptomyces TaxID=2593676 RepID=UPI001660D629|nr:MULTISPECIES: ATP-binding cassette domain-containing protein [unclassified Streptomyces]MBD0708489.1 ABC transporter ATP-binding protein [Streptomyces sp. CBMA291]MBD0717191.1 ABC transporter ATP-binding protein [Streptomyces sp. CBMA370]
MGSPRTEAGEEPHGAAVVADGFGLKGPRGWAFRGVSFRAAPGTLVAIEGPSGSGRTCLLLALTGRMKAREGTAEVGGLPLPRKMAAVRRISALGQVPGVSELDPAFSVAEHLRERALLQRRYDGSLRALLGRPGERAATSRERIEEALTAVGLDPAALPKGERTRVRDLERLEALRLSLALALIGRPRLLAVDDTDLKLSDADRATAWEVLRSVAAAGTTVLAVCSEAPEDALRITTTGTRPETTPEDTPEITPGTPPEGTPGTTSKDTPETTPGTPPETTSKDTPETTSKGASETTTEITTEERAAGAFVETGRA